MSYHAKKPREKKLKIHVEKMWYVAIEDETGAEVDIDYCFGTRDDAMRDGQRMLKNLQEVKV